MHPLKGAWFRSPSRGSGSGTLRPNITTNTQDGQPPTARQIAWSDIVTVVVEESLRQCYFPSRSEERARCNVRLATIPAPATRWSTA